MKKDVRWEDAQQTEVEFWDAMIKEDHSVLRVLADNSEKAPLLREVLPRVPQTAVEVGSGPFGLGIIGYLPEIPFRVAMDPLPPSPLDVTNLLRRYMQQRRSPIPYLVGLGEEIPLSTESMELVICCNVIDHTSKPDIILNEIRRILKPGGLFFFDVHTFSVLGLAKWHTWTKYKRKDEFLVRSHPYRMFEPAVCRQLERHGFKLQKVTGHTTLSGWVGHYRTSSFLGVKCV